MGWAEPEAAQGEPSFPPRPEVFKGLQAQNFPSYGGCRGLGWRGWAPELGSEAPLFPRRGAYPPGSDGGPPRHRACPRYASHWTWAYTPRVCPPGVAPCVPPLLWSPALLGGCITWGRPEPRGSWQAGGSWEPHGAGWQGHTAAGSAVVRWVPATVPTTGHGPGHLAGDLCVPVPPQAVGAMLSATSPSLSPASLCPSPPLVLGLLTVVSQRP